LNPFPILDTNGRKEKSIFCAFFKARGEMGASTSKQEINGDDSPRSTKFQSIKEPASPKGRVVSARAVQELVDMKQSAETKVLKDQLKSAKERIKKLEASRVQAWTLAEKNAKKYEKLVFLSKMTLLALLIAAVISITTIRYAANGNESKLAIAKNISNADVTRSPVDITEVVHAPIKHHHIREQTYQSAAAYIDAMILSKETFISTLKSPEAQEQTPEELWKYFGNQKSRLSYFALLTLVTVEVIPLELLSYRLLAVSCGVIFSIIGVVLFMIFFGPSLDRTNRLLVEATFSPAFLLAGRYLFMTHNDSFQIMGGILLIPGWIFSLLMLVSLLMLIGIDFGENAEWVAFSFLILESVVSYLVYLLEPFAPFASVHVVNGFLILLKMGDYFDGQHTISGGFKMSKISLMICSAFGLSLWYFSRENGPFHELLSSTSHENKMFPLVTDSSVWIEWTAILGGSTACVGLLIKATAKYDSTTKAWLRVIVGHIGSISAIIMGTYDMNFSMFLMGHLGLVIVHVAEYSSEIDPIETPLILHSILIVVSEYIRPRLTLMIGIGGEGVSNALLGTLGLFIHLIRLYNKMLLRFDSPADVQGCFKAFVINIALAVASINLSRTFMLVTALVAIAVFVVLMGCTVMKASPIFIAFLIGFAVLLILTGVNFMLPYEMDPTLRQQRDSL
jgi:hypothetical protein